ncbi:Planctomycete cytochrome C [Maioricimonas rarisocia]|uniref:Planctomycete cytochrome C n=1 Tax=Maioricimonas rarisocia TaxID=2528026 RepID=A0A517Z8Y0_9PLAN|nr:PSD1 and planctomycete cytochrome C domain-containing protein [Maioricimonas rarisocia]QDU38923.1 Planctomycete cytochrome C [Maioricimonas rarisocia]
MKLAIQRIVAVAAIGLGLPVCATAGAEDRTIDYVRDVKPILRAHCYECHGGSRVQAGLRLDTAEFAIDGGDTGAGLVVGDSAASRIVQAIEGASDEISQMPLEKPPLSPEQIATIRLWIDQGARHPEDEEPLGEGEIVSDHWSFQPLTHPAVPVDETSTWGQNAIDAFILRKLKQAGLQPSPEADRRTLIRRLSLDLTGLLPSPDEIDAFLADTGPGAYERLVDRLLASPHYGERWGRHWLDLARYADSNGFTIDGPREIWPYRDWVIHALNDDMPFDQFTIEQLAGDLLPEATLQQIVATGFHRNTLANQEGGTDDEQFRVESVVDRVSTTGSVWMGLTIGCAQCHDHKFDPITMRDFYRMYGVFNSTADNNDAAGLAPKVSLPSPQHRQKLSELNTQLADARKRQKELEAALAPRQQEWEASLAEHEPVTWNVVEPTRFVSSDGAEIQVLDDGSLLVGGTIPNHDDYEVEFTSNGTVTAIRLEVLPHDSLPKKGPGLAGNGNFVLTEFALQHGAESGEVQSIPLASATADHSQKDYPVAAVLDGDHKTGWAINVSSGNMNVARTAIISLAEPLEGDSPTPLTAVLYHRSPPNRKYQIGRFRLSTTNASADELMTSPEVLAAARIAPDERTDEQRTLLQKTFRDAQPDWQTAVREVAGLQKRIAALNKTIPTTLVMKELEQPRETFIHVRGNFLRKGKPVTPGVPAVLPEGEAAGERFTRLDLAKWLVNPEHPLTARVTVNRVWQRYFGQGLVQTENDFGTQGIPPTHPELLDWLAGEFIRQGWSLKQLHRLIVTSATYRQSSAVRADLLKADPANLLLGRQSRLRLEAEIVRDIALTAAGVLTPKVGGPPVYPPQPEGIYAFTQNRKPWPEEQGPDRFRRGLYTYFWRSSPHPMMPTFDAPDANTTCTRRVRSNTPLQALTLANDRTFIELSQALALRILAESPDYDPGRIRHGFVCALGREPTAEESDRLLQFLDGQRARFAASTEAAAAIAPESRPADVPIEEGAAWTTVARVLLNLDEFITRE